MIRVSLWEDNLKQIANRQSGDTLSAFYKPLSPGEETLAQHLNALKIPFEREFRFCEGRKWRADFLLTNTNILVEIEGGVEGKSRHTSYTGFFEDCLKYNRACLLGYRMLRYTFAMVKNGLATADIEEAIGRRL